MYRGYGLPGCNAPCSDSLKWSSRGPSSDCRLMVTDIVVAGASHAESGLCRGDSGFTAILFSRTAVAVLQAESPMSSKDSRTRTQESLVPSCPLA